MEPEVVPDFAAWTTEDWAAAGSIVQAIATILALAVAIAAALYARRQVGQARAQVLEARTSREEQAERHMQQSLDESKREQERRIAEAEREHRLRDEQARPFVVVDFEPSPVWGNLINLVVENVGKTLAREVRFVFDPPLESSQQTRPDHRISDSVLLSKGIPALPPGRRIEVFFDASHERVKTELPMTYEVEVFSKNAEGRDQEPLKYVLDLSYRYGLKRVEPKTMHNLVSTLEKIERKMGR